MRTTTEDDLKWVINAESNSDNNRYVEQWSFEKHLKSLQNDDIKHLIIVDNVNYKVGYLILAGLENDNNAIEFRRLVITEPNKGYGKFAIKYSIHLSFTKLNAHRLWLDVKVFNKKAIEMYERYGFKREGLLRESVLMDGYYDSLYLYSLLKNEYAELSQS